MPGKYFLDTNIFIYSFDQTSLKKKKKAIDLIKTALTSNKGIISYQVIQEFVNVAFRKFKEPLKPNDCKKYIDIFLAPMCEVFPGISLYREAIDIRSETGFSYYDSLIVAAAVNGNAEILYSEDMNDGQYIRGTQIVNPFAST